MLNIVFSRFSQKLSILRHMLLHNSNINVALAVISLVRKHLFRRWDTIISQAQERWCLSSKFVIFWLEYDEMLILWSSVWTTSGRFKISTLRAAKIGNFSNWKNAKIDGETKFFEAFLIAKPNKLQIDHRCYMSAVTVDYNDCTEKEWY